MNKDLKNDEYALERKILDYFKKNTREISRRIMASQDYTEDSPLSKAINSFMMGVNCGVDLAFTIFDDDVTQKPEPAEATNKERIDRLMLALSELEPDALRVALQNIEQVTGIDTRAQQVYNGVNYQYANIGGYGA